MEKKRKNNEKRSYTCGVIECLSHNASSPWFVFDRLYLDEYNHDSHADFDSRNSLDRAYIRVAQKVWLKQNMFGPVMAPSSWYFYTIFTMLYISKKSSVGVLVETKREHWCGHLWVPVCIRGGFSSGSAAATYSASSPLLMPMKCGQQGTNLLLLYRPDLLMRIPAAATGLSAAIF